MFLYASWLVSAIAVCLIFTNKYSISWVLNSLDTGLASLVLAILIVHYTKLKDYLAKFNLPLNIISIIITLIIAAITSSIFFGPTFLIDKAIDFNRIFFNPTVGRWVTTVAENRQPYFSEWGAYFGPFVRGIPLLFWLFILGSIVLFRKMLNDIKNKDAWVLTGTYFLFLFTLIFSRYSMNSMFNGDNLVSKGIYYLSGLIIAGAFAYYYIKYHRENNKSFEAINFEYIFLFVLFILGLFTARSAVRLIMVLAPITAIFVAFLCTEFLSNIKFSDKTKKLIWIVIAGIILLATAYTLFNFYESSKNDAYYSAPYYYTYQWQNAMSWVRDNTPTDSVFAHWWDYGYWVQSIGNRATVTDGGNAIVWWNYLMGRLVLTGDNQQEALNFLSAHYATHLLIDSSDITKYGAYAQIGSDENFDRFSQGPITFVVDQSSIIETRNETLRMYNMPIGNERIAVSPIEEDIIFNGTILFKENTGIIGLAISNINQPEAILSSGGRQVQVPMRYLYYNGEITDYGLGINATAYLIPRFYVNGQVDPFGAAIYISPRVMRGLFGQLYMLNDPFGNFNNFKLAYAEPDFVLRQIMNSGAKVNEFSYYEGLRGPIKIWNIAYNGDEQIKEEYLTKEVPEYITWKF
jgi:asparagine N-glycosylation enzyme membrane subunit Stt3